MSVNNDSAKQAQVPQPARPANKYEASQDGNKPADFTAPTAGAAGETLTGRPTLHGQVPPGLERRFDVAAAGQLPEFCKLPAPRERCPFTGASRSWLIDQAEAGNVKLVRVRQPGKVRGAVFVHVPSLLEFLRSQLPGGAR